MSNKYDTIIVGTGFASSFFLKSYLEKAKPTERILILERGRLDTHEWQVKNKKTSSIPSKESYINSNPEKLWVFTLGFGGSSNIWTACTPRMMVNDFQTRTIYGVGKDWPISYEELESYYQKAEEIMAISGPEDGPPYPRSKPHPQPPHIFSDPDRILKANYPDLFFQQPTARPRVKTANRPRCCASGNCAICGSNAKFTILNELAGLYQDPRVTSILEAEVINIETSNDIATGVRYLKNNVLYTDNADLVVLGANAIFNPNILSNSGLNHPKLGKFLCEQVGIGMFVDFKGLEGFQGSTGITGHGYMFYDGKHRSERAGCIIEFFNVTDSVRLRAGRGRWRERLHMKFIFEDIPSESNMVKSGGLLDNGLPGPPEVIYQGYSDYTSRGLDAIPDLLTKITDFLPVEAVAINEKPQPTEGHILGTTVMGNNFQDSIVDKYLIHHKVRNLVVLGSSVFPTCAPANPTLTISALSLWTANYIFG